MDCDLRTTLAMLQPLDGDFSPVVRVGRGGRALDDLTDGDVRQLMADSVIEDPGGDAKLAAAYLMGTVSWAVCEGLVGLAMRDRWLTAAKHGAVRLAARFARWEDEGEKGVSLAFDLFLDVDGTAFVDLPAHPGFATALEKVHVPIVNALYRLSGLSRAALWRLASDSLASAFLGQGDALDQVDAALTHARAILTEKSTKLANKQTNFEWVTLPEAPSEGGWMRRRGGCCRYYTAPRKDAEYCTTCVLRDPDSQRKRFQAYLRRKRPALE